MRPYTPVFLSQQELGDGSPRMPMKSVFHFTQHRGSWYEAFYETGESSKGMGTGEGHGLQCKEQRCYRLLEILRKVAPRLPRTGYVEEAHRSCAVVGNAWHLGGAGFGSEIDTHDVVMRVNSPPILG